MLSPRSAAALLLALTAAPLPAQNWNPNPTAVGLPASQGVLLNVSANWNPNSLPNPTTTAAFGTSTFTSTSIPTGATLQFGQMQFLSGAPTYTVTAALDGRLEIRGAIVNESGRTQNFVTTGGGPTNGFRFIGSASAGSGTTFTNNGFAATPAQSAAGLIGGSILFRDTSSADSATIVNKPGTVNGSLEFRESATAANATVLNEGGGGGARSGMTYFRNQATAGNASITNSGTVGTAPNPGGTLFDGFSTGGSASIVNAASLNGSQGGRTTFNENSTAGNATITSRAPTGGGGSGSVVFDQTSSAGNATITNEASRFTTAADGTVVSNQGARTQFLTASNAGQARITANGASGPGQGGSIFFQSNASAGTAILQADSGTNGGGGGLIAFEGNSSGSNASVKVFGNGQLAVVYHIAASLNIGSLEGTGIVNLQTRNLTVGSNNSHTTFAGRILAPNPGLPAIAGQVASTQGSLTKVGSGTLTLAGANAYTGPTTVNGGLIQFSAGNNLGTGRVVLNGGGLQWATGNTLDISSRLDPLGASGGIFDTNGNDVTLASSISGAGALIKNGDGTLSLAATNSYSGGTVVNDGFVEFEAFGSWGTGLITLNGGGILYSAEFASDISPFLAPLGANGAVIDTNGANITFAQPLSGTGSLTKRGAGTLILSTANTHSGGTYVKEGTIRVENSAALGSGAVFFIDPTLDYANGITIANPLVLMATTTLNEDVGSATQSGAISESGGSFGIEKTGAGTLVFSGANSYTGGTVISAGVLSISSDSNLGASSGSLAVNGATLQTTASLTTARATTIGSRGATFDVTNGTLLHQGSINGAGMLTKTSAGTLVLTGANSYTGGTRVTAGLINFSNVGNLGTGNITLDGGGLQWAAGNTSDISARLHELGANGASFDTNGNNVAFGNALSGPGRLDKLGEGMLTLATDNSYRGGTTISAGTLRLGDGGTTGSVIGDIVNNGTLTFHRSDAITHTGSITGTGNVVKLGSGTLTFNNAASLGYTGTTEVAEGTLRLESAQLSTSQVNIFSGATLSGSGSIAGNLVNAGVLSPQGTLRVGGNFTNTGAGLLLIRVSSAQVFDVLSIAGRANLGGTLQVLASTSYQPTPGDTLRILTAAGGVSGSFASVLQPGYFTLTYNADNVALGVAAPSEDSTPGAPGASGSTPGTGVLSPTAAAALSATIEPTLLQWQQLSLVNANVLYATIGARSAALRNGETGFAAYGMGDVLMPSGDDVKGAPDPKDPLRISEDNRWSGWVAGSGTFARVTAPSDLPSFNSETGSVTAGLDYRFGDDLAVGAFTGYLYNYGTFSDGSELSSNGGRFGIHSTYHRGGFWASGMVAGGFDDYSLFRETGAGATASSEPTGGVIQSALNSGYTWQLGNWLLGIDGGFQYTWLTVGAYSETGGDGLDASVGTQTVNSFKSNLGLTVSHRWDLSDSWAIIPSVGARWQYEMLNGAESVPVSLTDVPGANFDVNVPAGDRNMLVASGAIAFTFRNRATVSAGYLLQNSSNVLAQTITGQIAISF